jgi:divalent metal cation (Fe/Co/Zn/Cd) transporter
MTPLIPDTLQGALILSLIDFLLSFVIISFIGILLTGFPLLNHLAAWLAARRSASVAVPVVSKSAPVTDQDIPPEDVAAIVAAITAVMGEHRILHIEPAQHGGGWSSLGRQVQHQSHLPPRNTPR